MTDSLGTPDPGVPRHLFELDDAPNEETAEAVVLNMPATAKRTKRPPRKSAQVEGPVLLLTVEEAARSLSIGRSKTYELIADGALDAVHIGRSTRVPVTALHDLLHRLMAAGAEG